MPPPEPTPSIIRGVTRRRLAGWIRWLGVPWTDLALAVALIGAAAAPAFLVSAADVWQEAAGDGITATLAGAADPGRSGVVVTTLTVFDPDAVADADRSMRARIEEIDGIDDVVRYQYTFRGELVSDAPLGRAGTPVRLLSAPGIVDQLTVVDEAADPPPGPTAWISTWYAERTGLRPGDLIVYGSPLDPNVPGAEVAPGLGLPGVMTVAGIYEPVWTETGTVDVPYWRTVPADLVPRFLDPFNAPNFTLFVVAEDDIDGLLITGATRWVAPVTEVPVRLDAMRDLVGQYRALENDFARDAEIAQTLDALAGVFPPETTLDTDLPLTLARAESALGQLDQPLASARVAGVIVGLVIMGTAALFIVQRRRNEFVLLAGEGDRWWRFAPRAAAQLALPTILGGIIGFVAAAEIGRRIGPATTFDLGAARPGMVVGVVVTGLIGAALLTGFVAQGTLDRGTIGGRPHAVIAAIAVAALGAAVFLWASLGSGSTGSVDLSVIAFPIVGLVAAALIVATLLRVGANALGPRGGRLPLVPWMTLRRLGVRSNSPRIVTAAVAVGIGLIAFASMLVSSLDRAVEAKIATDVGGRSRAAVLTGNVEPSLPEATTIIGTSRSSLAGRNEVIRLVGIDLETFRGAVDWPEGFGSSVDEFLAWLDADAGADVPVVAIASQTFPDTGSLGTTRRFPFRVVGRVASFPLAGDFGLAVAVSLERIDRLELERVAEALGVGIEEAAASPEYTPPSSRFQTTAVSQLPMEDMQAFFESQGFVVRDRVTRAEHGGEVEVLAPRIAFDYLRLLGGVAAVAALAALLLYLAERRESRALAAVMTRRMGLSRRRSALITASEFVTLTTVAIATAALSAPTITERLLPRFDPAPALPPAVSLETPGWQMIAVAAAIVAAIGALVWTAEMLGSPGDRAEVLRALD